MQELKKESVGMAIEFDGKADWLKVPHTDVLDALTVRLSLRLSRVCFLRSVCVCSPHTPWVRG